MVKTVGVQELEELSRKDFERYLVLKRFKQRSLDAYLYYFDQFCKRYPNITKDAVFSFLERYPQQIPRAVIKNLLEYVITNDLTSMEVREQLIRIRIPKQTGRPRKRIAKIITEEQLRLLEKEFSNERYKLMLLLSFYGGLRVSELCNIKPFDFAWKLWKTDKSKPGKLVIIGKGDQQDYVFVPSWLMERIMEWIRTVASKKYPDPTQPLFHCRVRYWQQVLQNASINLFGESINPHSLRHAFATELLDHGFEITEIQQALRHRNISTTQIYLHSNKEKLGNKYSKLYG